MKHQHEALDFLRGRGTAGLFYTMGLGKTVIMLEHLQRLYNDGAHPFPCLIVCPLSGVGVWENEVVKFGYPFKVAKLVGPYRGRVERLNQSADLYLINYEGMRIIEQHLTKKTFMTMILDESHRVCNRGTQQTKTAMTLGQQIPNRYILTGTPITKSPEDIWTQFQIIAPGYLGNFYAFQARHIDFKKISIRVKGGSYREVRKPVRFKYLKELNQQLEQHSIRRTKEECLDLPEKIYKLIPCPLTDVQLKHYHGLKHSLATMIDGEQLRLNAMIAVMQKLQQVCQGFIYTDDKTAEFESGKQKIFFDLMEDLREEHVVVFTWFQYDVKLVCDKLKANGFNVVEYDGNYEERKAVVDTFQKAEGPMVFVSNVERAKESITLTAANHCVYYGQSWNYATRVQSEDRMHRIGQHKPVVYYDLVVKNTIDELMYDCIQYKGDIASKITGDATRVAKMILEQKEE